MTVFRRNVRSRWLLTVTAALVAIVAVAADSPFTCPGPAYGAYGQLQSDWCYQVNVTVVNTTGGTLTNQAARVAVNASGLIASEQMDPLTWSARPFTGSFVQESDLLAQDLASSTAGWWFHVPSLANGATQVTTMEFGLAEVQRNQGILFTGADSHTAPHDAAYNITDNLDLRSEIEVIDDTAQNATLASHWDANAGYRLRLVNATSTLAIRGQVDAQTCDVTWNSAWTDENIDVQMTFVNPTLTILVNGASQNSCNTGLASISTTSTPFVVGTSLANTIIRETRLLSGSSVVVHWGYNATDMAETSAVSPTYTGTIADISGNSRPATYTFTRSQTGITVTVGAVTLVSSGAIPTLPSELPSLLGTNIFGLGIGGVPTPVVTGGLFDDLYVPAITSFRGPDELAWGTVGGLVGLGFAVAAWFLFKYIPFSLFVAGIPFLFLAVRGYLPMWYLFIWGLIVVLGWFAVRQGEGSN